MEILFNSKLQIFLAYSGLITAEEMPPLHISGSTRSKTKGKEKSGGKKGRLYADGHFNEGFTEYWKQP